VKAADALSSIESNIPLYSGEFSQYDSIAIIFLSLLKEWGRLTKQEACTNILIIIHKVLPLNVGLMT
jgi:hypothetical protein